MKKILLSSMVAISLASSVHADFLGVEAGVATWSTSLSGTIQGTNSGDTSINLEDNLGYGDNSINNNYYWVYFDHPVPMLPNIKIQQTNYTTGTTKSTNITYGSKNYTGPVASSLTLDQTDFIGYYRILDNWVNLDLGINIKYISGEIKFSDSTATIDTNQAISLYIPMLYAKAKFDLPFTGLSTEIDASYIGYDGSSLTDYKAGIVYETSSGLGVTAGYRAENLTLDDIDNTNTNIDIDGMYLGVFYHF